jgi:hypothetical protein
MVELSGDEESLVMIEGIEIMTEYLTCVKKDLVQNDYIPQISKIMKMALDPLTPDEVRIRFSKLSGKILDRFSHFMFAS